MTVKYNDVEGSFYFIFLKVIFSYWFHTTDNCGLTDIKPAFKF